MSTATQVDPRPAHLVESEAAVNAAAARFDAAWQRIDQMQAQRSALTASIAGEADEKAADKLRRERRELAVELNQAPDDVVAVAQRYAAALLAWAGETHDWTQRTIHAADLERREPAAAAARARQRVDPSRPTGERDANVEAAAHDEINALAGVLNALNARVATARTHADAARCRVGAHLGDTINGQIASSASVPAWLDGVRRRASERAGVTS